MLRISVVIHRIDDSSKYFDVVDLIIKIVETIASVLTVFYQNYRALIDVPSTIDYEHVLVIIAVLFYKGLDTLIVLSC